MNNSKGAEDWLEDARKYLESTEKRLLAKDWRGSCQDGQLAIETLAKAIIACFEEPKWTHKPGEQLEKLLEENKTEIVKTIGENLFFELEEIGTVADDVAPWHGWGTYSKIESDRIISPFKISSEEASRELVQKVRQSYKIAAFFINKWFEE